MRTPTVHEARSLVGRLPGPASLVSPARLSKRVWATRLAMLAAALDETEPGRVTTQETDLDTISRHLTGGDLSQVWLALAVLSGRLPESQHVNDAYRSLSTRGPVGVLDAARSQATAASSTRRVEVVLGRTVVDMGDLVRYPLGTGIQRVVRMLGRSWEKTHNYTVVGWTDEMDAMIPLADDEREAVLYPTSSEGLELRQAQTVVVPWHCHYVLPELATQPRRCLSLNALARFSINHSTVVGHDCVPLTAPETAADGFPAHFALNLAAVAFFDLVVTVSHASATEYDGWRQMLSGAGLAGPRIEPLSLPVSVPQPSPAAVAAARERFIVGDLPMVLCVGSHEPRKNHLAVLAAAERLWRRGSHFSLVFVGGRSWGSEEFAELLAELREKGRPIEVASGLDDATLWAVYRLARLSVFPSLSEGFGLPVAESIAAGTPVVTSNYGSMREIGDGGGAVLVDPRSDDDVMEAMRSLLEDDARHADLVAACGRRSLGTWEQYSADMWTLIHEEGSSEYLAPTQTQAGRHHREHD